MRCPSEESCCRLQIGRAHHIIAVLELSARLQAALLELLLHHVHLVVVHRHRLQYSGLIFPLDLEFCNSRLFNKDVSSQPLDIGLFGWVLSELQLFIVVVHVVADSEELLVCVRASDQNTSHTDDVVLLDP